MKKVFSILALCALLTGCGCDRDPCMPKPSGPKPCCPKPACPKPCPPPVAPSNYCY